MSYRLRTFAEFLAAVREELQIPSQDTLALNRIKRDINIVYDEIMAHKTWSWLRGTTTLQVEAYPGSTFTASVVANSSTVTLTGTIPSSQRGKYFTTIGSSESYRIISHAAGSATLKLETTYNGVTDDGLAFRIWSYGIPLPSDCRETLEITHGYQSIPLQAVGLQEFRQRVAQLPKAEGRPAIYSTGDFIDPAPFSTITGLPALSTVASSGLVITLTFVSSVANYLSQGDRIEISGSGTDSFNGEYIISSVSSNIVTFTSRQLLDADAAADLTLVVKLANAETTEERYRELLIYPAINNTRTTLHVDYIREIRELINDTDEPLIPQEFRSLLLYGALHRAWARNRNPEEAARNYQLYQKMLDRMSGKLEDSIEFLNLQPSKTYLNSKRRSSFGLSNPGVFSSPTETGGSASSAISGSSNTVAVFDSTGTLVSSPTISTTELGYLDNTSSAVLGQSQTGTFTNKTMATSDNSIVDDANTVAVFNGSGNLDASSITSTELTYLDDVETLTSVTLTDNTSSATNVTTWTVASFDSIFVEYSLKRGSSNKETGRLMIASDGTNASMAESASTIGTLGVTFTVDVSSGSLRLRYTTTSTGTDVTMRYRVQKHLA